MRITLPNGKWRKRLKIKALPPFAELHMVRAGNCKIFRLHNDFNISASMSRQSNYNNLFITISPLGWRNKDFCSTRKMFCPKFYFPFFTMLMFIHYIAKKTPTPAMAMSDILFIRFHYCRFVFFCKILKRIIIFRFL